MPRVEYSGKVSVQKQLSKRTEDRDYYRYVIVVPQLLAKALELEGGEDLRAYVENGTLAFERAEEGGDQDA